jgi:hypothetical protein
MTDPAQQRQAALRQARESRGPADSYTDRSLYDRCITRGLVGSLTPAIYNAGNEIVQAPGYVVIRNEMSMKRAWCLSTAARTRPQRSSSGSATHVAIGKVTRSSSSVGARIKCLGGAANPWRTMRPAGI